MAVMSLMLVAVMGSSLSLSGTTERDVSSKRALAASMSGLDVARYRLNEVAPANNLCLTDQAAATGTGGAVAGECPPYSGDLGNGNTYRYYVTPQLVIGATCGGDTATGTGTWRCVTSYGTANGVTRRTQAMVQSDPVSTSMFPVNGVVGLDSVSINENGGGNVSSPVASNGTFTLKNCPTGSENEVTWMPGLGGNLNEDNKCLGTATTDTGHATTPWTLAPLDSLFAGTQTVNDNAGFAQWGFTYDAAKRSLSDGTNTTITIGPNNRTGSGGVWTVNVCSLKLTQATINLQPGAAVRFLIDSSERTGSGCTSTGKLDITAQGMNWSTQTGAGDPEALQFFFYGSGNINVNNGSGFAGVLYAPGAAVQVANDTTWTGAIAAKSVNAVSGFQFTGVDVSGVTGPSGGTSTYARSGFVECRSVPTTATDPESGC